MPITPEQARSRNRTSDDDYRYFTNRIDKMLVEGGRTFSLYGMPSDVIFRIIKDYNTVGWSIENVPDWRGGDYLRFKENY